MTDRPKDISTLVRETASKWRENFLQKNYAHDKTPLEKHVDDYMARIFTGLLDQMLGIDRSFGRVEFSRRARTGEGGMVAELTALAKPHVLKTAAELFQAAQPIKLTPKERESLRDGFRRTLMRAIEDRLKELALERAKAITAHELDQFMTNDEWIPIVEKRVVEGVAE